MKLNLPRILAAWIGIIAAETVHGILRNSLIRPAIGDMRSRQIGVFVGSAIIFVILYFSICWIGARSRAGLLATGLILVVLTLIFELSLGFALGLSADRIIEDYDLRRGGLMVFGILFLFLSPMMAAKMRNCSQE
ncbi:MAG TPA: hypothetical protein PKD26_11350 [Pyrinomonadaceae bacterium]|nr:hypothetical protein [Pyrinomonadaceae bacterium]